MSKGAMKFSKPCVGMFLQGGVKALSIVEFVSWLNFSVKKLWNFKYILNFWPGRKCRLTRDGDDRHSIFVWYWKTSKRKTKRGLAVLWWDLLKSFQTNFLSYYPNHLFFSSSSQLGLFLCLRCDFDLRITAIVQIRVAGGWIPIIFNYLVMTHDKYFVSFYTARRPRSLLLHLGDRCDARYLCH